MLSNTFYLEAPACTQDLLNIKWALRSAGYTIGSTWHDGEACQPCPGSSENWHAKRLEQLEACDSLVVIAERRDIALHKLSFSDVGMMAGFALARGLQVIWIGTPVPGLSDVRDLQQFDTAEDFRRHVLCQVHSQAQLAEEQLAA